MTKPIRSNRKLDQVSNWYSSHQGLNGYMIKCLFNIFKPYIKSPVLEVGAADGYMTQLVQTELHPKSHDIVEASLNYTKILKHKFPSLTIHPAFIEEVNLSKKYRTIIASHVLEHVPKPQSFLVSLKKQLQPSGRILLSVPNALSIHRLLGVEMGLLEAPEALNAQDKKIGHYRVYTPSTFKKEISQAGLHMEKWSTSFVKFLSNLQFEKQIDKEKWPYFWKLTKYFPENGADIYAICTN